MGHHFGWAPPERKRRTQIGRVTILVLFINDPELIALRGAAGKRACLGDRSAGLAGITRSFPSQEAAAALKWASSTRPSFELFLFFGRMTLIAAASSDVLMCAT